MREDIIDLVETGSNVLDVGCGTGDFLFRASNKIAFGLGVDLDPGMISFAASRKEKSEVHNLEFVQANIESLPEIDKYNINLVTSTLCLHEMKQHNAIKVLEMLASLSPEILIADYSTPKSTWARVSIEFDELMSGHYGRFRAYRCSGYVPFLAKAAGLRVGFAKESRIDGISIWKLSARNYA